MAKKIRIKTVVYDRTAQEWVQKNMTMPISDELAAMLAKEIDENITNLRSSGHGTGRNYNKRIPGMKTPLADQKRYYMDTQLHIIEDDEDETELNGWRGF